jgi:hypothetical protein
MHEEIKSLSPSKYRAGHDYILRRHSAERRLSARLCTCQNGKQYHLEGVKRGPLSA